MSGTPFSFADAFARQARQRLEQERPVAREYAHPTKANENLPQASPEEVRQRPAAIARIRKSMTP